jgi:hypothetical protein
LRWNVALGGGWSGREVGLSQEIIGFMVNIVYPPGQFESREHYLEYFLVTEWRKPEGQANAIEQAWVIQASLKELRKAHE